MDKKEVMKKAYEYSKLVKNYLIYRSAVLFGSYVNGQPREDSDIDIAFFVDKLGDNEDYYSLLIQLNKLTRMVDCRIEPHILLNETNTGFNELIRKTGEVINLSD